MSETCKLIPDAPNGKPSKLFQDINARFRNREDAKLLWGFTRTPLFQIGYPNIEKDENGEPTYEALDKLMNLNNLLSVTERETSRAITLGILNNLGRPVVYDTPQEAMSKANEFNRDSELKVAVTEKTNDGKYQSKVLDSTSANLARADKNQARADLNVHLVNLLNRLGFDMKFMDDPSFVSIFDPLNAETNARNLKTVIRVANTDSGREELPEEVSHLIIAGLKDDVLKQRINSVFTDDVVRAVLGNEYDSYYDKYKNGRMPVQERMREEAEGKLLSRILKGVNTESKKLETPKTLLGRLWNKAMSMFRKSSEQEIDNIIVNASNAIKPLAELIRTGEVEQVIDAESILKHDRMYALTSQLEKLAELAEDGEVLLSKKLYILQNTHMDFTPEQMKRLRNDIENVRAELKDQRYESACYQTLYSIGIDIQEMMEEAEKLGILTSESTDLGVICDQANLVKKMTTFSKGYTSYLNTMAMLPTLVKRGEIEMKEEHAEQIAKLANETLSELRVLEEDSGKMRYAVIKQLITLYYGNIGKKPEGFEETDKHKWESVDMIMQQASRDLPWWDTNLFSAGDSRNPILNTLHKIVVKQQAKRNNIINKYISKMSEADAKLKKAGYDNKFVCQFDEEGVATGYYVGEVDMYAYEKDRAAFIETVNNDQTHDYHEKKQMIEDWEREHTEFVEVGQYKRKERHPAKKYYENKDYNKGWSKEQQEYYDSVINMKIEMDDMLPYPVQNKYTMPQVRKSITQMFDKDGNGALKTLWSNWKKEFSIVDDNMDYSKNITAKTKDGKVSVLLDFDEKNPRAIKRVPIYFAHKLENRRDLSTDATHAMNNYICMAVNFDAMGQLANAMQLMQEYIEEDYEVKQSKGGAVVRDMFKALGMKYERDYMTKGKQNKVVKAIDDYIDRQFFNDTKKQIGNVQVLGKNVSLDATFNALLKLTSVSRLGLNILSGITNKTQGETQITCEALTGRFFDVKDEGWSQKEYYKLLLPYIGSFNSSDRHDRLYLLINQFNASEDYFRDMMERNYNKSAFKRVMGKGNIFFLNTMGEHNLHARGMLMILNHEKVRLLSKGKDSQPISLYEAITEVHDENGWHLELADDIEFVDKNRAFLCGMDAEETGIVKKTDRDELFENLSVYINKINADMHGGYSEAEKGNANQHALWRFALQFRQWMFGMYNKLYAGSYYDTILQVRREGGYVQMWHWIEGVIHDYKNVGLKLALEQNQLTTQERKNVNVALANSGMFLFLAAMCWLTAGWKDEDDRALRLAYYSMLRLKLETGALAATFPKSFVQNMFTIVQKPAAAIDTLENFTDLLDIFYLSDEVASGRFKGWNKSIKTLYKLTPIYNVQKVIDMKDYNYMFNIFN